MTQADPSTAPTAVTVQHPGAHAPVSDGLPNPVQWSEGMLLSPQHFQQADAYWQAQLQHRQALLQPDGWGLSLLDIDPVALASGQVRLRRLECLMPDGTAVVFPGGYTTALQADLAPLALAEGQRVKVHLVLPTRSPAAARRDAALRRYDVALGALAVDENTGVGAVSVDRLVPRLSLWLGDEIPPAYTSCPLLELMRDPVTRQYVLTPYLPPLLQWSAPVAAAKGGVQTELQDLLLALWEALRSLTDHRDDDGPEPPQATPGLRRRHARAQHLASTLPGLHLALRQPSTPPAAVYHALAQTVGAMAFFGANPLPLLPEPYRHIDSEPQFRRLAAYIRRKLSYIDTGLDIWAFEHIRSRFERTLPETATGPWLIELRMGENRRPTAAECESLARWLGAACIASESVLAEAQRLRVSARARWLPPSETAQRGMAGSGVYFEIQNAFIEASSQAALRPLIQPGQRLVIDPDPQTRECAPDQILLCQFHANAEAAPAGRNSGPVRHVH